MAEVNLSVRINGQEFKEYCLSYERSQDICSGISTLVITFDPSVPANLNQSDVITIYEGGNLKGTYYISTVERDPTKGFTAQCQDRSKRLQEYFIAEFYNTMGESSRYWIERVCKMAKVGVSFDGVGDGFYLNPYDQIALEPAYDVVLRLCQQNGWYFYFDSSGECIIGELDVSWSDYDFDIIEANNKIMAEYIDTNDELYRNRVLVWGGGSTSEGSRIAVELTARTGYDRNSNDKRTTVFSNGYIKDTDTAYRIGGDILREFSQNIAVKMYEIAGAVDASVGDVAHCRTTIYKGLGLVYAVTSKVDVNKGLTTKLVIDSRCPRLFGYWAYGAGDYIYVGTKSHGIYRKPLNGSTWTAYNTGITNLNIRDLKVKNGFLIATTDGKEVYTRLIVDPSWEQITPDSFVLSEGAALSTENFVGAGCGIRTIDGSAFVGYNDNLNELAYVMQLLPTDVEEFTQVVVEGKSKITILDTDTDDTHTWLTAVTSGGLSPVGVIWQNIGQIALNERGPAFRGLIDENLVSLGPVGDSTTSSIHSNTDTRGWYVTGNAVYTVGNSTAVRIDLYDSSIDSANFGSSMGAITDCWIYPDSDDTGYILDDSIDRYSYTISTNTRTFLNSVTSNVFTGASKPSQNGQYLYYVKNASGQFTLYKYDIVNDSEISSSAPITYGGESKFGILQEIDASTRIFILDDVAYAVCVSMYNVNSSTEIKCVATILTMGGYTQEVLYNDTPSGVTLKSYTAYSYHLTQNKSGVGYATAEFNWADNDNSWWSKTYRIVLPGGESGIVSDKSGASGENSDAGVWSFYRRSGTTWAGVNHKYAVVGRSDAFFFTSTVDSTGVVTGGYLVDAGAETIYDISTYGISVSSTNFYGNSGTVLDDYDNTLIVVGSSSPYYRSINPRTGAVVKTYNTLPYYNGARYTLLPGFIVADYPTNTRFYISSFTGGASSPPAAGNKLIALKNYIEVTASGDTYEEVGTFTTTASGIIQVDIPLSAPVLFFGGTFKETNEGEYVISEVTASGEDSFETVSNTATPNARKSLETLGYYSDARMANVLGLSYNDYGKEYQESIDRGGNYLFATVPSGEDGIGAVYFKDLSDIGSNWVLFDTFSGSVNKIETTNYTGASPHVFVSISGAPSQFWQLDPGEDAFVEYSNGLPESNITVIRVDDRI